MKSQSRRTLLLIFAFLSLPFATGTLLYFAGWRPEGRVNHGQLIEPPATLASPGEWEGKWSLLLVHDGPCSASCAQRLDELRRIRISLGQQMGRTRLAWTGQAIAADAVRMKAAIPDLVILDVGTRELGPLPPGSVVLVDPNGLAIMRYAPESSPRGMRDDLERLLKYSWSA